VNESLFEEGGKEVTKQRGKDSGKRKAHRRVSRGSQRERRVEAKECRDAEDTEIRGEEIEEEKRKASGLEGLSYRFRGRSVRANEKPKSPRATAARGAPG
jgi:hypothetical protein